MKQIIKKLLFPNYNKWEKILVTKNGIYYRLIMRRQNADSGLYQFKSILIGEIDEEPEIKELFNLI